MKQLILTLLLSSMLVSCKDSGLSKGILPKEKYQKMMTELIIAAKIKEQIKNDKLNQTDPIRLVYQKYDVDSLQIKKSTDYYSRHPEILLEIYKNAKKKLQKTLDSLEKSDTQRNKKLVDSIKNKKIKVPKGIIKKKLSENKQVTKK